MESDPQKTDNTHKKRTLIDSYLFQSNNVFLSTSLSLSPVPSVWTLEKKSLRRWNDIERKLLYASANILRVTEEPIYSNIQYSVFHQILYAPIGVSYYKLHKNIFY